jgi:hypothetical protein
MQIRMYGQGFGDCFLLTFPRVTHAGDGPADRPVHVLIDCGVVMGTPDDAARMREIVADIGTATNFRLDLLVLTHEHWDHLSGFVKAEAEWEAIQVDALWMAWTEKPDPDGLPGVLKRILDKQRLALTRISDHALRFGFEREQETALGLMSFLADAPVDGQSFAAAASVADALAAAKRKVDDEDRRVYCEPGEVRPIPDTEANCYVLGPPRSDERLRQTGPSKDRETFELAAAQGGGVPVEELRRKRNQRLAEGNAAWSLRAMEANRSAFNAFAMPLLGPSLFTIDGAPVSSADGEGSRQAEMDWESYEQSFPFERSHRIPLAEAERAAAEAPEAYPVFASYCDEVYHWRRIDFDWLSEASAFALQADNLTNNTSLVLAIELPAPAGGKRQVLLFAADAQVGNWLSWYDIEAWKPTDGAAPSQVTPDIPELLGRVVFYKVGHHGSHNATLKHLGLEKMPADGSMTAFVPVSMVVAHEYKNWDGIPLESLLDALSQRCGGKVLFPDGNVWPLATGERLEAERQRIGVTISQESLPAKRRRTDDGEITLEPPVPLWSELEVEF